MMNDFDSARTNTYIIFATVGHGRPGQHSSRWDLPSSREAQNLSKITRKYGSFRKLVVPCRGSLDIGGLSWGPLSWKLPASADVAATPRGAQRQAQADLPSMRATVHFLCTDLSMKFTSSLSQAYQTGRANGGQGGTIPSLIKKTKASKHIIWYSLPPAHDMATALMICPEYYTFMSLGSIY